MHLNPSIYHRIVRPRFAIRKYVEEIILKEFSLDNSRVLDFGCGTGSNSPIFRPDQYLGVDIDQKRISFAAKHFPQYTFKIIKNGILPVKDHSIRYICIFATIHHMPDKAFLGYISEFRRVLKKGGRILVIEPVIRESHAVKNWYMKTFDNGKFIRREEEYEKLFSKHFSVAVHKRFGKLLYNELFFSATPK